MDARISLNPKSKTLTIGAILAWVLFLAVLNSDGAETVSADCLSCSGEEVETTSEMAKVDFSSYVFDPSKIDVAEGVRSSALPIAGMKQDSRMGLVSRKSVMDVYYNADVLIPCSDHDVSGVGLDLADPAPTSGVAENQAEEKSATKKTDFSKKRRVISLLYLLACAESQK